MRDRVDLRGSVDVNSFLFARRSELGEKTIIRTLSDHLMHRKPAKNALRIRKIPDVDESS